MIWIRDTALKSLEAFMFLLGVAFVGGIILYNGLIVLWGIGVLLEDLGWLIAKVAGWTFKIIFGM
jgi:hypothetical protein